MSELRKNLGRRIKELRKSKNLKQSQLAELVGIETTSICKIENGDHFPKEDNLEKIANSLNVEIQELFAFAHLKSRKALIDDIISILDKSDDDRVKIAYKVINDISL